MTLSQPIWWHDAYSVQKIHDDERHSLVYHPLRWTTALVQQGDQHNVCIVHTFWVANNSLSSWPVISCSAVGSPSSAETRVRYEAVNCSTLLNTDVYIDVTVRRGECMWCNGCECILTHEGLSTAVCVAGRPARAMWWSYPPIVPQPTNQPTHHTEKGMFNDVNILTSFSVPESQDRRVYSPEPSKYSAGEPQRSQGLPHR